LDLEVHDLHTVDHSALAQSVHQGILLAPPPFRIALFGPWGSGKSTLLRQVEQVVKDTHRVDSDSELFCKTLWFNPWHYESDPNLLLSLIVALSSEIPDGVRYSRRGAKLVREVITAADWLGRRRRDRRARTNDDLDLEGTEEGGDAARVEIVRDAVRRFIDMILVQAPKHRARRLVVFIDDLDKCLPDNALALLDCLKLFFDRGSNIVLVFTVDRDVLSAAIQQRHQTGPHFEADLYLEKVFEFSYNVPPIEFGQLKPLIQVLYERAGLGRTSDDVAGDLACIDQVLTRPGIVLSPRKFKRIFNRFIWFLSSRAWLEVEAPQVGEPAAAIEGFNPEDYAVDPRRLWLAWLLTTEYFRTFRGFVAAYGDAAIGELCNRVTGNLLYPHSNQLAHEAFDNEIAGNRTLLEYYRPIFDVGGGAHRPAVQGIMRARVVEMSRIDRVLRRHGI
jgi:energy-coupling factor transporter ATP-binding protein EcfA2